MIKAIIFDMDGVLVDAKQWHFEALNQALELFGFRISQFEHYQRFDGLPTREKLRIVSREQGLPETLQDFINEIKQHYLLETAAKLCQPNPIHIRALRRLREEAYDLALASNSIRRSVDELMHRTSLESFFSFTLSNQDVSMPKPSPEIYETAIERLGHSPSECLVIEDGDYGVAAAKAAGAHLLRVESVHDVSYANIRTRIDQIDSGAAKRKAAQILCN